MVTAQVAALFVETDGCYFGLNGVDPWDEARDARTYDGPHPVIAHPPCQRWGKYWYRAKLSQPRNSKGADAGCFAAALTAVRNHGGVLEHPVGSSAFRYFGIRTPIAEEGWVPVDEFGGFACVVEQGHYGHICPKPSVLYAVKCELPEMPWGKSAAAKRIEQLSSTDPRRWGTPPEFRDVLLTMARSAHAWGIA